MSEFKRVLLKLSGEILAGERKFGHDFAVINEIAEELLKMHNSGFEISIVIGGGNLIRGRDIREYGVDRIQADSMGMLGTVMNAIAIKDSLAKKNLDADIFSAVGMSPIAELYNREKALKSMKNGHIVIFGAGTGHPFFSTDTAAALRGAEMGVDCVIKGTKVNGIYDKDPAKFSDAKFLPELTFSEALNLNIEVMDAAAFAICRESKIPVWVISVKEKNWSNYIFEGPKKSGTLVKEG